MEIRGLFAFMAPCRGYVVVKISISLPLFFVIAFFPPQALGLDFSQGLVLGGGTVFSRAPGFGTKPQGMVEAELENLLSGRSFGGALILGLHSAAPSGIRGGYGYRGWEGMHLRLSGEMYLSPARRRVGGEGNPDAASGGMLLRPGFGAALGGFFSMYRHTEILFFYPSLRLQPFADLIPPRSLVRLRFALPVEVFFRRDLDVSWAVGLGAAGVFRWDAFMEKRRRGRL